MNEPQNKARRLFFRQSLLTAGLGATSLAAGPGALANTLGALCGLTPPQTEGPFYPVKNQPDKDNDLTLVQGRTDRAQGKAIVISGLVQDEACQPLPGVLVEIWQACASGKYNHPADPNTAPLDPNFQYWGRAVTDANGMYRFRTIIPGAYPADVGWIRPPHIHYKAHKLGFYELTTQLYFEGNPLNSQDRILNALPVKDRNRVVTKLFPDPQGSGVELCRFDLILKKVGATVSF